MILSIIQFDEWPRCLQIVCRAPPAYDSVRWIVLIQKTTARPFQRKYQRHAHGSSSYWIPPLPFEARRMARAKVYTAPWTKKNWQNKAFTVDYVPFHHFLSSVWLRCKQQIEDMGVKDLAARNAPFLKVIRFFRPVERSLTNLGVLDENAKKATSRKESLRNKREGARVEEVRFINFNECKVALQRGNYSGQNNLSRSA